VTLREKPLPDTAARPQGIRRISDFAQARSAIRSGRMQGEADRRVVLTLWAHGGLDEPAAPAEPA
jgi:hypothetical protein